MILGSFEVTTEVFVLFAIPLMCSETMRGRWRIEEALEMSQRRKNPND